MTHSLSSDEIRTLTHLAKRVTKPGARWSEKPSGRPAHKQRSFEVVATGTGKRRLRFRIFQRQSLQHEASYSCGIMYRLPAGKWLTLARYNGSNHRHGDIRYKPHIHQASETAILVGSRPENDAKQTDRYRTLEGALACLIEDFNVTGISADHDHPSLFNGHQN